MLKLLKILDNICWSSLKQPVQNGQYFTPFGRNVCETCKCLAGKAVGCFFEKCPQLPACENYKPVEGKCCEFECTEGKKRIISFDLRAACTLLTTIFFLKDCLSSFREWIIRQNRISGAVLVRYRTSAFVSIFNVGVVLSTSRNEEIKERTR